MTDVKHLMVADKIGKANARNIISWYAHYLYGTSVESLCRLSLQGIVYNPPGALKMFGFFHDDYDYSCEHCGAGYYADVGMGPLICETCGEPVTKPTLIIENHPDDDVLLDERYITFDPIKAFRILRSLGRLDDCIYDEAK